LKQILKKWNLNIASGLAHPPPQWKHSRDTHVIIFTHTHTHTHTYIYIYMCVCVCNNKFRSIKSHLSPALHPGRSGFCDSLTLVNKALGSFETPITGCTGLFRMAVGVFTTCHTQYTWDRSICIFLFCLIEQHSKFLLHALQVLYMCTLCDSTNITTIIEFVPNVNGDGFKGGSDSYLHFRDTHAPSLLKLCIPPSNGIVRWWLFPEFGAELPLDNCTPTIILNNPVFTSRHGIIWQKTWIFL